MTLAQRIENATVRDSDAIPDNFWEDDADVLDDDTVWGHLEGDIKDGSDSEPLAASIGIINGLIVGSVTWIALAIFFVWL